jgi:uncharacterized protein involved in outer membrane biogenesis
MKRALIALAAGLAVIVLALAAALAVVVAAPDRLKPLVVALVARDGRQSITLDGPISLSLLPRPVLRAERVTLGTRAGRIEAGQFLAHLALRPLLSREIVVTRLDLDHAVFHPAPQEAISNALPETVSHAAPASVAAASAPAPAGKPRHWRISLLALRLTDARVATAAPLSIIRLDLPALPGPSATAITLDARYAGIPFSLSGMIARLPGDALSFGGLRVVAQQGDVALDGTLHLAPHPAFAGKVTIHRLDLDALRHALPRHALAPAAAAGEAPAPSAAPPPDWRDRPLAFLPLLDAADLDLAVAAGTVIESGAAYHDIATHLALHDRHLVLDPLRLEVPGGAVSGVLRVDAAATPPAMTLHLLAPSLALGPLAGAFHWPDENTGALEIFADLSAAGATPRALMASLGGRVGIAAVNATLANSLLLRALGEIVRQARLPPIGLESGGHTDLRCLALGGEIAGGIVHLDPALAETSRLTLGAGGTLDLGAAAMAVRLVPSLRIGGNALVVPLRLDGPLAAPKLMPDPDQGDGALAAVPCESALARARGGRAGPAPAPAKPAKGLSLRDILRELAK